MGETIHPVLEIEKEVEPLSWDRQEAIEYSVSDEKDVTTDIEVHTMCNLQHLF